MKAAQIKCHLLSEGLSGSPRDPTHLLHTFAPHHWLFLPVKQDLGVELAEPSYILKADPVPSPLVPQTI